MHLSECQTFTFNGGEITEIVWPQPKRGAAVIQNAGDNTITVGSAADIAAGNGVELNSGEVLYFTEQGGLSALTDGKGRVTVLELNGKAPAGEGQLTQTQVEVTNRAVVLVDENPNRLNVHCKNYGPAAVTIGGSGVQYGSNGLVLPPGAELILECTSTLYAISKVETRLVPGPDPDDELRTVQDVVVVSVTEEIM